MALSSRDPAAIAERYATVRPGAPAYERIKELVMEQVRSGNWTEGDQLPSESQWVSALGLSRMTVNRALRELTADGVVERVMGLGTFVAPTKSSSGLFEVRNIADDVAVRGHRHSSTVQFVRHEPTGAPVVFDGTTGGVYHSLIVHREDGRPIQIEDRYVNPVVVPDYVEQDFTRSTPNDYLNRVAPLTRGEHVVEAVLATPQECELLEIDRGEPCLLIRRRTWSGENLVSVARLLHPGSRSRLEGSFGGR